MMKLTESKGRKKSLLVRADADCHQNGPVIIKKNSLPGKSHGKSICSIEYKWTCRQT